MKIWNLTPHNIDIFHPSQFIDLVSKGPTVLNADGFEGSPIASYPSMGEARIATYTEVVTTNPEMGEVVTTRYGEATGIPEGIESGDVIIVSLPMQSMAAAAGHPLAEQMASPYKVVRSAQNGSLVLGCMGLSFQKKKEERFYPKFANVPGGLKGKIYVTPR
jgi:hypothetical protein